MPIFIASAPRTGSMWAYGVTRDLLEESGKTVLPDRQKRSVHAEKEELLREAYSAQAGEDTVYCIKLHSLLTPGLPGTKVITPYRDVRDSMISHIKFTFPNKTDGLFELALMTLIEHMNTTDFYFESHPEGLKVNFNDIVNNPASILEQICRYLELHVSNEKLLAIEEKFSKKNTSKIIKDLDELHVKSDGVIEGQEDSTAYETVKNPDGTIRIINKAYGFQTNHITSEDKKGWQEYFTPQQRDQINRLVLPWLNKYGFQV